MRNITTILLASCLLSACAKGAERVQPGTLIVAFNDQVSERDAQNILSDLFKREKDAAFKLLNNDQRPLDEIREKYPQRAIRAPAALSSDVPLIYKVNAAFSEQRIERIISQSKDRKEIIFIQRNYQVQPYE